MAYPGNPWAGNVLPLEDGPNFPLLKYSRKERRVLSNSYDEAGLAHTTPLPVNTFVENVAQRIKNAGQHVAKVETIPKAQNVVARDTRTRTRDVERCGPLDRATRISGSSLARRKTRGLSAFPTASKLVMPRASRMPPSSRSLFQGREEKRRGRQMNWWSGREEEKAGELDAMSYGEWEAPKEYLRYTEVLSSVREKRCWLLLRPTAPPPAVHSTSHITAVLDILPYVGNTPQPSSTMYPPHAVAIVHVSPNLMPRLPAPQSLLKSNHTAYHPDVPFASSPVQLSTDTTTLNITSRLRSPTHPHKQKQHRHHQHPYPAHARALEQASTPASSAVPIGTFASRRTSFPSSPCLPLVPNARQAAHPPPLPNAATILARRSSGVGSAAAKREAPTGRSERACTARSTTMQCGLADCDDDAALEVTARLAEGAAAASASTRQAITVRLGGPRCHSLSAPHRIPAYRRPVRANNAGLRLVSSRRQDPVSTNEPLRPRVGARPFHRKRKRSLAHASRCPLEALRPRPIACRRRASSAPVRPARRTATRGATSHSMTHRLQSSIDPIVCTPTSARHAPRCVAGLGDEGPAGVVARVPCRIAAAAQQRTPRSAGAPGLAAQLPRCITPILVGVWYARTLARQQREAGRRCLCPLRFRLVVICAPAIPGTRQCGVGVGLRDTSLRRDTLSSPVTMHAPGMCTRRSVFNPDRSGGHTRDSVRVPQ
ncbi:uncharacterized protein CC84DRAFT_1205728 [Paraphaeosphaeria sporulosa]|uniref:Uncharacterized protein n=1 Tax=Paraphaeosphaeria sporulosa TaxID=1460663 RepID=A0A177CGR9_9PLEO|nr:uncharacterized protein CC84DRAFT_1205728 [Paraphaeosphaeria sporulosa]OAG06142.1 hypothetical protein CC84DRAFT_1205728 [Paraphaeosphaeria sporulosa]